MRPFVALSLLTLSSLLSNVAAVRYENTTSLQNSTGSKNATIFPPLFRLHTNSTPVFTNETHKNVNPLFAVAHPIAINGTKRPSPALAVRAAAAGDGTCAPGTPCSNGACCSKSGFCGYSPDFCGSANCISNCDAKAQCGPYAVAGKDKCPLNVCCSQYGFCGSTSEFCGTGCQSQYGGCGTAPRQSCSGSSISKRTIGYYESWAATRPCDKMFPEDLVLTGLTHLNFAFAFFDPATFRIAPMDSNAASLYSRFTALKSKSPTLQPWISVGGWSFNDETNVPNTRKAFSDMASTSSGRATFISSLMQFMRTYGFTGVDIDWEYPSADDRGGKPADTANFVSLTKEIRQAFGSTYGMSVTLPASYWYLQHFDLKSMEPYVDWFNMMTYDIHGVWDSTNKFTGPYVRPHTNLTEIDEGLDLCWRAGISPDKVVMGLGYYGRSFTLKDPACKTPGCLFTAGGKAGACSAASGVLTNAEIFRIIKANNLKPITDSVAAINYITWDTDQWVSYDDAKTFEMKKAFANRRCLGGTMIWAIDQDDTAGSSNSALIGTGANNQRFKQSVPAEFYAKAVTSNLVSNMCYTSFCNKACAPGYISVSQMKGMVGAIQFDTSCGRNLYQNLCCPSGAIMGTCTWRGFKGQGLACNSGCNDDESEMAINSHMSLREPKNLRLVDQMCNGGYLSYCCKGTILTASAKVDLLQVTDTVYDPKDLAKRDLEARGVERGDTLLRDGVMLDAMLYGGISYGDLYNDGIDVIPGTGPYVMGYPNTRNRVNGGGAIQKPGPAPKPKIVQKPKNVAFNAAGQRLYGTYAQVTYAQGVNFCTVTYTCKYGNGFDEVCDNQRYGVTMLRGGNTVYHMNGNAAGQRSVAQWPNQRHPSWRVFPTTVGFWSGASQTRSVCERDEFPMAALSEAWNTAPQAVRLVDGVQNGKQGRDFQDWKWATFAPCSLLLGQAPPVTWAFDMSPLGAGDGRRNVNGLVRKFGFDSMSPANRCYAQRTINGAVTVVPDHGFRVHTGDPMYGGVPYLWNNGRRQSWAADPAVLAAANFPTSVNSANYMKRAAELATATCSVSDYTAVEMSESAEFGPELAAFLEQQEAFGASPPPPEPTSSEPHVDFHGEDHAHSDIHVRGHGHRHYHRRRALPGSPIRQLGPQKTAG